MNFSRALIHQHVLQLRNPVINSMCRKFGLLRELSRLHRMRRTNKKKAHPFKGRLFFDLLFSHTD